VPNLLDKIASAASANTLFTGGRLNNTISPTYIQMMQEITVRSIFVIFVRLKTVVLCLFYAKIRKISVSFEL
jgi:hypothetical protein